MLPIPTLTEVRDQLIDDLEAEINFVIPLFGRSIIRAIAYVLSGSMYLQYLYIAKVQQNVAEDTADPEASGGTVERFGRIILGRNPFPATAGQYDVEVTGTVTATIPAGTVFKADDASASPGELYILDAEFELLTNPDTITVRALTAGVDAIMNNGDTMTATVPLIDVNQQGEVTAEVVQPISAESLDTYRNLISQARRLEPTGGAATDYRVWASDVQGVRLVFPFTKVGESEVIDLFIEANFVDSTDGKGTPSAGIISDVTDVVEFDPDTTLPVEQRGRRPLGNYEINFAAITPLDVDIVVNDFVGNTAALEAQINAALAAFLFDVRPFVPGIDELAGRKDTFSENDIAFIIQSVQISVFGSIVLDVDSVTVSSYQFEDGEIPHLNNLTINDA